jgi:hypothetical protein
MGGVTLNMLEEELQRLEIMYDVFTTRLTKAREKTELECVISILQSRFLQLKQELATCCTQLDEKSRMIGGDPDPNQQEVIDKFPALISQVNVKIARLKHEISTRSANNTTITTINNNNNKRVKIDGEGSEVGDDDEDNNLSDTEVDDDDDEEEEDDVLPMIRQENQKRTRQTFSANEHVMILSYWYVKREMCQILYSNPAFWSDFPLHLMETEKTLQQVMEHWVNSVYVKHRTLEAALKYTEQRYQDEIKSMKKILLGKVKTVGFQHVEF